MSAVACSRSIVLSIADHARTLARTIGLLALSSLPPTMAFAQPQPGSAPSAVFEPFTLATRQHGNVPAELGTVPVPRRHADPAGATLSLRFVRLPATGAASAPPVVYLAGGPGGSGIDAAAGARWPVFDAVRRYADVILLDQRGTGRSDPPPPCPAPSAPVFPMDQPLRADDAFDAMRREAARCVAAWRVMGVDLDSYSTIESAHDIEAVRRALGVEHLSLWAMSYGTHLALATMRLYPDRVAYAVLMGAEGLDHTLKLPANADRQLDLLHDWALQDASARQFTHDLRGALRRHLARLDSAPVAVPMPGLPKPFVLGAFDLQVVVAGMLGRAQYNAMLPMLLGALDAGDARLLAQLALSVRLQGTRINAMSFAMDAASGASRARRERVAHEEHTSVLGRALNFPWPDLGDSAGIADLGDAFRAPLTSATPTLFVSGTLDGRTPVSNAEDVMRGFSQATHLILDEAGHDDDLWTSSPIVAERVSAFLAGRRVAGGTIATGMLRVPLGMTLAP